MNLCKKYSTLSKPDTPIKGELQKENKAIDTFCHIIVLQTCWIHIRKNIALTQVFIENLGENITFKSQASNWVS